MLSLWGWDTTAIDMQRLPDDTAREVIVAISLVVHVVAVVLLLPPTREADTFAPHLAFAMPMHVVWHCWRMSNHCSSGMLPTSVPMMSVPRVKQITVVQAHRVTAFPKFSAVHLREKVVATKQNRPPTRPKIA